MRAIAVTALGGPEVLQIVEYPNPVAGPGQVLVRVRAACVNPADLAARIGDMPGGADPPPFQPGWDIAGEVAAVGEGLTGYRVGDRVAGMIPWFLTRGRPGGYAELVAAAADWLVPVPAGLDLDTAATVPLNALTAHVALDVLPLPRGSTLLVIGASGGVGGFAVQLAVRRRLRVIAVANDGDEDWVRELGADEVVPRSAGLSAVEAVPAVFDAAAVGLPAAAPLADGGILATTRPVDPVDPGRRVRQQLVLVKLNQLALGELIRDAAEGRLRTRVAETLPLAEAAQAHRQVEAGGLRGKIVLRP
jgi:NADPH:quinone reductase-like Zn-dependent oxidoreductase